MSRHSLSVLEVGSSRLDRDLSHVATRSTTDSSRQKSDSLSFLYSSRTYYMICNPVSKLYAGAEAEEVTSAVSRVEGEDAAAMS